MKSEAIKILAGDIGGTKTILQLSEYSDGKLIPIVEKRYESQKFDTFERVLTRFYSDLNINHGDIQIACVGVAGPVEQTASRATTKVTNLTWNLDSSALKEQFSIKQFRLINDFQAVGYGVQQLADSDIVVLQAGRVTENATNKLTKAVIGAGTGLGQAILAWDEIHNCYEVMPSEAGHCSFAPTTARERNLLEYLSGRSPFVSVEQVVSGPGITNIYHFLNQEKSDMPGEILLSANNSVDITPVIIKKALQNEDLLAVEALDIFLNAFGSAAGNFALTVAATGGVYIAGGIAPKIIDEMRDGKFIAAFNAKSKMKPWLESIPVYLVVNEKIGLSGAADFGLKSCLVG